jgi:mevalonate kinase
MAVSAESSGKLLLFGEHVALYGYPAVGISLPWSTCVTIDEDSEAHGWNIPALAEDEHSRLWELMRFMFETFPLLHRKGYSLTIESNIPRGMGFGSSAALCIAFIKAVIMIVKERFFPASWDMHWLWSLANRAEGLFHCRASGIDTGLSLFGQMRGFHFDTAQSGVGALPVHREVRTSDLFLVVGAVPRDGNTRQHVAGLASRLENGDSAAQSSLARLGEVSREALAVLEQSGAAVSPLSSADLAVALGSLADRANSEIEALGLSNDALRQILTLGRSAGASGGKVSGSGNGGAFYLVARDIDVAREVHAALARYMRESGLGAQPLVVVRRTKNTTCIEDS